MTANVVNEEDYDEDEDEDDEEDIEDEDHSEQLAEAVDDEGEEVRSSFQIYLLLIYRSLPSFFCLVRICNKVHRLQSGAFVYSWKKGE